MNVFNRGFLTLLALAWIAALAVGIWLVWDESRFVEISNNALSLNFDLFANTESERILATIIAVALMLPALGLLMLEMKPSRHREVADSDSRRMQDRISTLERELGEERQRNKDLQADNDRVRDTVEDRVRDRADTHHGRRSWNPFARAR
jgi:hypothetical protein